MTELGLQLEDLPWKSPFSPLEGSFLISDTGIVITQEFVVSVRLNNREGNSWQAVEHDRRQASQQARPELQGRRGGWRAMGIDLCPTELTHSLLGKETNQMCI